MTWCVLPITRKSENKICVCATIKPNPKRLESSELLVIVFKIITCNNTVIEKFLGIQVLS